MMQNFNFKKMGDDASDFARRAVSNFLARTGRSEGAVQPNDFYKLPEGANGKGAR